MAKGQPTGRDVARVAGVSKSAVSRAFTGGIVSDDAREKILNAARILRYRPNKSARSLTTSRSQLIGLAITALDNQLYPPLVEMLHHRAARGGYRLVLFITHGDADLDPVLDELLGYRLDGVILASSSHASRVARECLEGGVPVVMLNNVDPEGRIPGVCTDAEAGTRAIASWLVGNGRKRIGLISGLVESSANVERVAAFTRAIAEHPGACLFNVNGHFTVEGAYQAAHTLLTMRDPVDALFCVTDMMALSALEAVRELGLTPGREVAVFGFDDVPMAARPSFALATYSQPIAAMVEATFDLLDAQIEGKPFDHGTIRLQGDLKIRTSAGG